jgi:hypothetical protein
LQEGAIFVNGAPISVLISVALSVLTVLGAAAITGYFHRTRFRRGALGSCLAIGLLGVTANYSPAQETALLAHDINGFALDMTVEQVTALANGPLISVGGGQYQMSKEGIDYSFSFSALGHLYRIDSLQEIGSFTPDAAFASDLSGRLAKKFGPPQSNQLPQGPAAWMFQETYTGAKGEKLNRENESLIVLIAGGNGKPVSVEFQLFAPRILRRDAQSSSAAPKS